MSMTSARAAILPLLLMTAVVAGCSVLLNFQKDQCTTDGDCTAKGVGFESSTCGADHVCTHAGEGGAGCVSNKQCVDENSALPYACVTPGKPCVNLLSEDCTQVVGDFTADNVVYFGDMAAIKVNAEQQQIAQNYLNALTMAVKEVNQSAGGLVNPGHPGRSPVFVVCDDLANPQRALNHLVNDVKIPGAIIDADTAVTLDLASKIAIPARVLTIAPNDPTPQFRDFSPKNGLLWTTWSPEDKLAVALTKIVPEEEAKIKADQSKTTVKLVVIAFNDGTNQSVANAFESNLKFNNMTPLANGANYLRVNTGDPKNPDGYDYTNDIAAVLAKQPDIIVAFGGSVVLDGMLGPIEAQWPVGPPRPTYAFTEGLFTPALLDAVSSQPNLRLRVRGVRRTPVTGEPHDGFVLRYRAAANNVDPVPGVDHLYDSVYMLMYLTVAASGSPTLDGKALSDQMALLNPPASNKINVGPQDLNKGFTTLITHTAIDLVGASSNLDYDLSTGVIKYQPLEVGCISAPVGTPQFAAAGETFDADLNLAGTYNCP